jgi:hypothetical protein
MIVGSTDRWMGGITLDSTVPTRQVRAKFSEMHVRVYQAFAPEIARKALAAQTFVPPFRRRRMTWIKPSFTWMMYRSSWAKKPGQEYILGVDMLRSGFEWALANSCLSSFEADLHGTKENWNSMLKDAPVRIQWDPERTLQLGALPYRTIQVGLSGEAVDAYVQEWIMGIEDVTSLCKEVEAAVRSGDRDRAERLAPAEVPYPLPDSIARRIYCSVIP